ncbi:ribonuclease [Desertihabitans brevis]|uniref:Ribonuclease n=1 Tax=Desertihabitans brevis TaxID=2268447 RepID=A0A367YS59_9ACTN|nr:ribonuclease [Desertihabitans brevis]
MWSDPGGEAVPPPVTTPSAAPSQTPTGGDPSGGGVQGRDQEQVGTDVDPQTGLPWVRLEQLPPEAAETVELIEDGGPFPYRQDGAVFNNFEGLLPEEPRGHYREYTVPTPGEDDRGARRIVTGEDDTVFFWTADHYGSFERIAR